MSPDIVSLMLVVCNVAHVRRQMHKRINQSYQLPTLSKQKLMRDNFKQRTMSNTHAILKRNNPSMNLGNNL